jgi:hypothetical protein
MVHPPACAGAERRHLSRGARPRPRPERKICPRLPVRCAASAVTSSDILQYWFMCSCPLLARLLVFACLRHFPASPRTARHPHPLLITRSPLPDIECVYFSNNDFIARHRAEESA